MKKTLLIVEDDADVRTLVRATLEHGALRIVEAENGAQGLEMARALKPDFVLLDVMMPGMTGYDVCAEIKGDPDLAGTVVVLLTAKESDEDRASGETAGADLYLTKPFSPTQLLDFVDGLLQEDIP